MAVNSLNPGVQKTNDPTYLGSSQGTDRASLQPLASVPDLSTKTITPDFKPNTTTGTAIKGLGDLGSAALSLTDAVIQQKATDTLRKGIDDIRDGFGVAQAADQSSGIARAVGAGGAEGVSLQTADASANQPIAINRLGNRVEGLTESYKQGGLSNSAYYAKLEAYVREVKAQFPGYGEIIDQKVSNIVGTTPANALRQSLLQDVTALQTKVAGQNDKWTAYENNNAQYIFKQWPNYEADKANGRAPDQATVRQVVGRMQARDYTYKSDDAAIANQTANIGLARQNSESTVVQRAADLASSLSVATTNTMGLKSPQDFQQLFQDVASGTRKPLSPEEKAQVTASFAVMKQQYGIQFDKMVNSPLTEGSTMTHAALIADPNKITAIRTKGMQHIADLEDGLVNEKYGLLAATANFNKASDEAAENSLIRSDKNAALIGAARKKLGDQGLLTLYTQSPQMISSSLEGLRQAGWVDMTSDGTAVKTTLDKLKKESNNDGSLIKTHLNDAKSAIVNPEKFDDPTSAKKAVNYLFGEGNRTLIDGFQSKTQVAVFTDLGSPTVTKAISKMDKESQTKYTTFMEDGFASVFNNQADNINQTAENYKINGNLKLVYDPDKIAFRYESGSGGAAGITQAANSKLQGFNTALGTMKDVWALSKKDSLSEVYRLLPVVGVEGGSPLFKAVQDQYMAKNKPAN